MSELIIIVGISRSGKSTIARWKANDKNYVCVNRDKIREQLFSYTEENIHEYYKSLNFKENEKLVSRILLNNIRFLLTEGHNIIIDNTHLKKEYIDLYIQEFPECEINFIIVDADLELSLERDKNSIRQVGEDIIRKQYNDYNKLISSYNFNTVPIRINPIIQDSKLPPVVIFDIDGTLSDSSHRHIFTDVEEEIYEDKVIEAVQTICNSSKDQVIFVSGRSDKHRVITEKWIKDKVTGISPILFMRKEGDYRRDTIIKEEILREVSQHYNILFAVDDRLSVTRHLRKLGIFVLNCLQTDKEF